jgi:hypothetical protein
MKSKATSVAAYLKELPPDRREAIALVREMMLANLGEGFEEGMSYGMIGYFVPHRIYPAGYHCNPEQPLPFAGLASQKSHMSLYLMCVYGQSDLESQVRAGFELAGKKLDMGKACIRFKRVDDLALDVLGKLVRGLTLAKYVERYEQALAGLKGTPSKREQAKAGAARTKPSVKTAKKVKTVKTAKKVNKKVATKRAGSRVS